MAEKSIEIGYLTDVEGNLEYFDRWIEHSGVLFYSNGSEELMLKHEYSYFVYGGDAMDRFDGSLRLTRRLVSLKKRYPDRVFLLAGNRDLNKVRLTAELSDQDMLRHCSEIPRPHWDPNAPSLAEFLAKMAAESGDKQIPADLDSKANRLRYILQHTLGCPHGFELRRRELTITRGPEQSAPSDDDVVASMLDDMAPAEGGKPPGILREYLSLASLVCILGNTLFVHGALDPTAIALVPHDSTRFCCPSAPQSFRPVDGGPVPWAEEMNRLLQRGLEAHAVNPTWDTSRTRFGGEVLAALQNLSALSGRCVVSGAYASGGTITSAEARLKRSKLEETAAQDTCQGRHSGNLFQDGWLSDPRDPTVAAWLQAAGIRRVVVGHKPSGDSPAVLNTCYTGVEVISADTSYADVGSADGRGVSIAGVTLVGPSLRRNAARVFGVCRDGREHDATLATLDSSGTTEGGDDMVGRELEDGWWCKARIVRQADRAVYLCCRGHGRTVEYRDHTVTSGGGLWHGTESRLPLHTRVAALSLLNYQ